MHPNKLPGVWEQRPGCRVPLPTVVPMPRLPCPLARPLLLPQVDAPRRFRLGQWVRVYINDASTGAGVSWAGECCVSAQLARTVLRRRPSAVPTASPPPRADGSEPPASEGEAEGAYSLQQRAAAGGAAAPAGSGGGSGGGSSAEQGQPARLAAAPNGSIAAWVYGEGLADSGSGAVLHEDEISFTARWAGAFRRQPGRGAAAHACLALPAERRPAQQRRRGRARAERRVPRPQRSAGGGDAERGRRAHHAPRACRAARAPQGGVHRPGLGGPGPRAALPRCDARPARWPVKRVQPCPARALLAQPPCSSTNARATRTPPWSGGAARLAGRGACRRAGAAARGRGEPDDPVCVSGAVVHAAGLAGEGPRRPACR